MIKTNRVVIKNVGSRETSGSKSENGGAKRTKCVGTTRRIVAFGINANLNVIQRRDSKVEISIQGPENRVSRIITRNVFGTLFVYQGSLPLSVFTSLISGNSVSVSGNGNTVISSPASDSQMDVTIKAPNGSTMRTFGVSGSVRFATE